MSMWQLSAAVEGYIKANTVDDKKSLSNSEKDELWDMISQGTA